MFLMLNDENQIWGERSARMTVIDMQPMRMAESGRLKKRLACATSCSRRDRPGPSRPFAVAAPGPSSGPGAALADLLPGALGERVVLVAERVAGQRDPVVDVARVDEDRSRQDVRGRGVTELIVEVEHLERCETLEIEALAMGGQQLAKLDAVERDRALVGTHHRHALGVHARRQ